MADEKDEQIVFPEEAIPDHLKGKVLVAKVGKEQQFLEQLHNAARIAQGSLGWDGQADIMYACGGIEIVSGGEIKADPKWTEAEHKQAIKELLQQCHLQSIMENAEWVTEEEADKRRKSLEVLYGNKDSRNSNNGT